MPLRFDRAMQTLMAAALLGCLAIVMVAGTALGAADALWSDVAETSIDVTGPRLIMPERYRTVALDMRALRALLAGAPMERTDAARRHPVEMRLPLPGGRLGRFAIVESPIMAPALAARYPRIRTYAGQGLDDRTASVRFDLTPAGFHAQILSAGGTVYVDPHHRGTTTYYISYARRDYPSRADRGSFEGCDLRDDDGMAAVIAELIDQGAAAAASGSQLRTYRTAIAATGEYTQFHGGTVAAGLAAVVTALNRVTGVYEREVAIRMELIANNDTIIYTDPGTDPYSNGNGGAMLGQNQANLDAVIGNANYDIGHVFSTGGGGVAGLAVVCRAGSKAYGVTGLPSPIGDRFYIDYVAHEMGHQYAGNHCFNGTAGSCGGGRWGPSAYEPGSGSTIMAYAGICGSHNIQSFSDDYFHTKSFDEIIAYTTAGSGNSCPVTTNTGNDAPIAVAGPGGFTIPIGTPFELTGTAIDPNGDEVTYCWEEYDLGPGGDPNNPSGNAPIFRTFLPTDSPTRMFPKLSDVVSGIQTRGEILPSYARNLSFRLTARDNRVLGGGVGHDQMSISVTDQAGPFLVTGLDVPTQWTGGTLETITWDVAGTDQPPVNCQVVDILFSTLVGQSFDYVLASGTPNDGSETIVVPNVETFFGRVMVKAADHVILDINNAHIRVEQGTTAVEEEAATATAAAAAAGFQLHAAKPNPFNPSTEISFDLPGEARVTLRVYDLAGREVKTLVTGTLPGGRHTVAWDGTDDRGRSVASGIYLYRLHAADVSRTRRMVLLK